MTRFDFSPLFRSTVGFDRVMNALEAGMRTADEGYPPYNIEKVGEHDYRIAMAVAGFGEDELSVEAKDATVTVSGRIAASEDGKRSYLHRGIAGRGFSRSFQLAEHVRVSGRVAGERPAPCRSRARGARGAEAPRDRHPQRPRPPPHRGLTQPAGKADPRKAPGAKPGAFFLRAARSRIAACRHVPQDASIHRRDGQRAGPRYRRFHEESETSWRAVR